MKIGIIVDGPGDKAALDARFEKKFKVIKTDGPRGHDVSIQKIVSGARKQVRILKALQCNKIILMLDYENRPSNYCTFVKSLKSEMKSKYPNEDIYVVVPNMMIENWFLADIEHLSKKKKYFRPKQKQRSFEGTNGKKELKKLLLKNCSYKEIQHGKELFPLVRQEVAMKNSPSFKDLIVPH